MFTFKQKIPLQLSRCSCQKETKCDHIYSCVKVENHEMYLVGSGTSMTHGFCPSPCHAEIIRRDTFFYRNQSSDNHCDNSFNAPIFFCCVNGFGQSRKPAFWPGTGFRSMFTVRAIILYLRKAFSKSVLVTAS